MIQTGRGRGARVALVLALASALYWLSDINSQEGYGPGYWMWLGGIALMCAGSLRAQAAQGGSGPEG